MGTGMDDIEDFREFIYHYILPQPEIDPQALQQEQIELDHLNDVLLQAKERAQLLTEIGTLGETARAKQRDCSVNRGFVLYARQQAAEGAEEQILSAICDGNREIDRLQEELQYQKERTEQAHQRWMDALRENQNSPERQQLQVFEDLVKDREKRLHGGPKSPLLSTKRQTGAGSPQSKAVRLQTSTSGRTDAGCH